MTAHKRIITKKPNTPQNFIFKTEANNILTNLKNKKKIELVIRTNFVFPRQGTEELCCLLFASYGVLLCILLARVTNIISISSFLFLLPIQTHNRPQHCVTVFESPISIYYDITLYDI